MEEDFDPSLYVRAPKLDVAAAVALSVRLLVALPKTSQPPVKKAALRLRKSVLKLQKVWKERDRLEKPSDTRPIDVLADNAMGRLYSRLEGFM